MKDRLLFLPKLWRLRGSPRSPPHHKLCAAFFPRNLQALRERKDP